MAQICYMKGDVTQPVGEGAKMIIHIVNDRGGWGAGFVLALSRKWSGPEGEYRAWWRSKRNFELGRIQVVRVEEECWVVNMLAQHGYRSKAVPVALSYEALASCLVKVRDTAKQLGAGVHAPRIGAGLGGGEWSRIEEMLQSILVVAGVEVTIYDL